MAESIFHGKQIQQGSAPVDRLDKINHSTNSGDPKDIVNVEYLDQAFNDNDMFANYKTNDVDEVGDTLYIGKEKPDSTYLVEKFVFTGNDVDVTYANLSNNGTKANYVTAWIDRLTLVYNKISTLTDL